MEDEEDPLVVQDPGSETKVTTLGRAILDRECLINGGSKIPFNLEGQKDEEQVNNNKIYIYKENLRKDRTLRVICISPHSVHSIHADACAQSLCRHDNTSLDDECYS